MKKIMTLVLLGFSFCNLHAQVKAGVRVGLNSSYTELSYAKLRPGFDAGFVASVQLKDRFFLQPELSYSFQTWRTRDHYIDGKRGQDFHYLYLPVLAKYHVASKLFVEAGPQVGYLYKAKILYPQSSYDATVEYSRVQFGALVGAGYQFTNRFGLSARYYHDISNATQVEGLELRRKMIQVGAALVF